MGLVDVARNVRDFFCHDFNTIVLGLLLLLFLSRTSGGMGLGGGDSDFVSTGFSWVRVICLVGAGVEVKLKTGILSAWREGKVGIDGKALISDIGLRSTF